MLPIEIVNNIVMMSRPKPKITLSDLWYHGELDFVNYCHRVIEKQIIAKHHKGNYKDSGLCKECYDEIQEIPFMKWSELTSPFDLDSSNYPKTI